MAAPELTTYSSLRPFRASFERGRPILMYHKLGPRPSGTRLKGLYVSTSLFAKQLQEFREGGFKAESLGCVMQPLERPNRRVVVSFDDGFLNVLRYGLGPLATCGFRAIQYLPVNFLGGHNEWEQQEGEVAEPLMGRAEVKEWLAAGQEIGSHTLNHPWLTRVPLEVAREEIVASKLKLEDLFGVAVEHFCYPYGDWNPKVRDLVMAAGYKTAVTTRAGINGPEQSPFELLRMTARYPSRNLKAIWARWRARLQPAG